MSTIRGNISVLDDVSHTKLDTLNNVLTNGLTVTDVESNTRLDSLNTELIAVNTKLTDVNTKLSGELLVRGELSVQDGITVVDEGSHTKLDALNDKLAGELTVNDVEGNTKLETLNNTLNTRLVHINDNLRQSVQQSHNKYNFYGLNNEVILNEGGEDIYADTVPPPMRDPTNKEGWFYFNENAGNKFNYYYFSNTAYLVPANQVLGQFCIFENQSVTTENVNVLLSIYAGTDFFNDGLRVYTSSAKIKPGVKYLAYWGQDPNIFPGLPRLEYTLAVNRNWNGSLNVLTMSVGSDSGYAPQTVANLMTHMGYVDANDGVVTSHLIGSSDNINASSQLVKLSRDIKDEVQIASQVVTVSEQIRDQLQSGTMQVNNSLVLLGDKLDQVNTTLVTLMTDVLQAGLNSIIAKLDSVIILDNSGGNGGGGVELRSIIPDTDPSGTTGLLGGGLTTFTWEFTTTTATQYDLYALTNGLVTGDDEKIFTMYLSNDVNETTILDPSIFFSKNENQITMNLPAGESDYVINFSDSMSGETAQAEITLQPNTTYTFKCSTTFNNDDNTNADIRFAITEALSTDSLGLNYVSGVNETGETSMP